MQAAGNIILASPDGSFGPAVAQKLGGRPTCTGFESWLGRLFVIEVVHIYYSKLFKSMECFLWYCGL